MANQAIRQERLEKAAVVIRKVTQRMEEIKLIEVMGELGWDDLLSYNASGNVELILNDLQQVALASALGAIWEQQEYEQRMES